MLVFQFLSAEHALSNIALKRIRISRWAELNDPFELFGATLAERDLRTRLSAWRRDYNKEHGLICFCKTWQHPVLWSHYAAKHRGICLAFELDDAHASEVVYAPDRLEIQLRNGLDTPVPEHIERLRLTKSDHWHYEQEVRMFVPLESWDVENGSYFHSFSDTLHLRGVMLGPLCEMPIDGVRALVHGTYSSVSVVKARLAFKSFTVAAYEQSVRDDVAFQVARGQTPLWVLKGSGASAPSATITPPLIRPRPPSKKKVKIKRAKAKP